jgi:hypothetical protein
MSDNPFWRGSLELHYADFWLVDGISDVLIWGYAENGVGMIVGCVATLRPSFRRVFNLGEDSVPERTPKDRPAWPNSSVRYGRREEEWVALHEPNDAKAKGSSTQLPGSEGEEHILGNGIKTTQTILQSVTHPGEEEHGTRKN